MILRSIARLDSSRAVGPRTIASRGVALDDAHIRLTLPLPILPWLSTWVSLALDENWPQLKRRRLIKEAVELYRWRGTRWGLTRYLELYTGITPEINDQPFIGMRLGREALLGRHTVLGDVPPHTFVLTLAMTGPGQVNEQKVHEIIQANKPAHAAYELRIVERGPGE